MRTSLGLLLLLLPAACRSNPPPQPAPPAPSAVPAAPAPNAEPAPPLPSAEPVPAAPSVEPAPPAASAEPAPLDEGRARKEAQLDEARRALESDPASEENLIWLGRRFAYLERFDEAQATYARGLELHPSSWKILRHRGHRWITLRKFDAALEDLARAWELCKSTPDEIEPDGQPNPSGVPIGSYHSNIIYHLALAHYLRGEWSAAAEVWDRGRALNATNDDRLCSSTYWNHLALRRAGRDVEAMALLDAVARPMRILENESYHLLCLMFRGERTPEQVMADSEPGTIEFATRGYGVACWRLLQGEEDAARELLRRIVEGGPRNSFGCIAAEVDLAR